MDFVHLELNVSGSVSNQTSTLLTLTQKYRPKKSIVLLGTADNGYSRSITIYSGGEVQPLASSYTGIHGEFIYPLD